ncbi:MAG: Cof-type HAD-IIB family hydrolase [Treponema sp.]|jgi:Cof subfamily protein (haloacid dehalogenase superfamily)|nr:Cof-type HAD-IIB family hydrolase [Treponema sp.]
MHIKALALDLDGTALMPDNTLGQRTVKILRELIARGIQIIFCTGRAIEAAEQYRAAIGAEGAMVFFNGAEVVDVPSGKILSANLLDLEVVEFGIDMARNMGLHYQIYLPPGGGKYEALLVDRPTPEAEMYHSHTGIRPIVKNLKEAIGMPGLQGCIKAMFICDPEYHDEIRKKLLDRFGQTIYVARTYATFLEIMNAGVSKGEGLKIVMKHRGLDAKELIALGDEENDLLMFDAVGFSAAPANAREKVKAAADYVFGSNAEEGIAAFLEDKFLKRTL